MTNILIPGRRKNVAVFDIDGTILDTMPKMRADVKAAFGRLGYSVTNEQIASQKGWYDLATQLGVSKEAYDQEFDKRKSWEDSLRDGEAPLFPDTLPCLDELASSGITLAALTKSDPCYTKAKLDYHGLNRYFGDRVAVTPVTSKSKREQAADLVNRINPNTIKKAYFLGDRAEDVLVERDINDAYSLSTGGIWVNREAKPTPQELQPYHQVFSLTQAPPIILGR